MRVKLLLIGWLMGSFCLSCATTTRSTEVEWSEPQEGQAKEGEVVWIRRSVYHTEGNPAAGAIAGAVIGGVLGGALTGRDAGVAAGAVAGSVIGARASQGSRQLRIYDVYVHFDDGTRHVFRYRGYPPFRPGQRVALTSRGLMGRGVVTPPVESSVASGDVAAAGPAESDEDTEASEEQAEAGGTIASPSSPMPQNPPPPPAYRGAPTTTPDGVWVYTAQYGWIWMPYGQQYTFTPAYEDGDPYMYVYYPAVGWTWVDAPWLFGWGVIPYFAPGIVNFAWYGHGWGPRWRGYYRPRHYRNRRWVRRRHRHSPFYRRNRGSPRARRGQQRAYHRPTRRPSRRGSGRRRGGGRRRR